MQVQPENIQIDWCPGASSAEFKFQTHRQAASFADQFLSATQLFSALIRDDADNVKPKLRQLKPYKWIPENHCPRWIYIDDMMSFFNEEKTSFRLMISMVGSNQGLDMGTMIGSILRYGVNIQPEQFCFQNPTKSNSFEERDRVLFHDLLALIENRYSNPQIKLEIVSITDSKSWLKEAEYLQVVQAVKEASCYEINWTPLADSIDFVFPTHQHLKNFLQRFLEATHLFIDQQNLSPADNSRSAAREFNLQSNAISGWIYIRNMSDVLRQHKNSMTMNVTMVGGNSKIDTIAILTSILTHGPYPRADQFAFKRTWKGKTHEELRDNRFQAMLNLMALPHDIDSGVHFKLVDFKEWKFFMSNQQCIQLHDQLRLLQSRKPEKYNYLDQSIFGDIAQPVIEQPAKENPKREMPEEQRLGWAAVAPADDKRPKVWPEAEPAAALVQEQDRATAPIIPLESSHEIRQRLMASTLPALLAKLSMCDDPDELLRVEASLRGLLVANNPPAQPQVASASDVYSNPPGLNNNNF